ncbi:MAG: RNHCP domain-containing protein [bacterium]|nr:RNHCP domain-containing protein [bacterium]
MVEVIQFLISKKVKNFVKKEEDFVCKVCKEEVKGTGYTNHCPNCLYSLHVDEEIPGDRNSKCKGLMEPVKIEIKKSEYILFHKCAICKKQTRNKTSKEDNLEEMIKLL